MANQVVRMGDDWHNFDEYRFGPREDYAKMDYHEGWVGRLDSASPRWTLKVDDWDKRYACWRGVGKDIPDRHALFGHSNSSPASHGGHSCEHCIKIPVSRLVGSPTESYELCDGVAQLEEIAKDCTLYQMILSCIGTRRSSNMRPITISIAEPGPDSISRLLIYLGSATEKTKAKMELPILPDCNSQLYFDQLLRWTTRCVRGHSHQGDEDFGRLYSLGRRERHRKRQHFDRLHPWQRRERQQFGHYEWNIADRELPHSTDTRLPSRVLDVGKPERPDALCIRETGGCAVGKYIAVSHRWGETDEQFQTTTENIQDRQENLSYDKLPQTFKDAVIVARCLGVQFLWIDSLCIKQDDALDKMTELKCMEEVFSSAFCTIAATSARNCKDGFLRRSGENCVRLFEGSENPQVSIYVTEWANNFDDDVEKAELNERAWVLQERALSRRTIHFAAAQAYWECGSAIGCETIGEYHWIKPSNPLSSSDFPALNPSSHTQDPQLVQSIFRTYSRLRLSKQEDKPWAIAGLEYRLATSYHTLSVYGIFYRFFGPSLLWKRFGTGLERIGNVKENVPSWSWMAYDGEICYHDVPFDGLSQNGDFEFRYTEGCTLAAPLKCISLLHSLEQCEDTNYRIRETEKGITGWVRYDDDRSQEDTERLEYIVILELPSGLTYGLLVKNAERNNEYRRIGVVAVEGKHEVLKGEQVIVI